jgi:hypothetical protein
MSAKTMEFDPPPVVYRAEKRPCTFCGFMEETLAHPGAKRRHDSRPMTDPGICFGCAVWATQAFLADREAQQSAARRDGEG